MVIKYTKNFNSKALQNISKLGFLYQNIPSDNPASNAEVISNLKSHQSQAAVVNSLEPVENII
jgi:hypothetical protein